MAVPKRIPWLHLEHTKTTSTLVESTNALRSLEFSREALPSFTLMVGKTTKSTALQYLVRHGGDCFADSHGEVFLWHDSFSPNHCYVDYELHVYGQRPFGMPDSSPTVREMDWLDTDEMFTRRRFANLLCGRAIAPICTTLCYFAADLGGLRGVASLLAAQMRLSPAANLPSDCLPHVLIVTDKPARKRDSNVAQNDFLDALSRLICADEGSETIDISNRVAQHFRKIQVLGLSSTVSPQGRALQTRQRVEELRQEALRARTARRFLFRRDHAFTFMSRSLDHFFRAYKSPFSFINVSRPTHFTLEEVGHHLRNLIRILPSEAWLWHLVCPLLSSAIILCNYPPGSHVFPIDIVFDELYRPVIRKVFAEACVQPAMREALERAVEMQIQTLFDTSSNLEDIAAFHASHLTELWPYLSKLRSQRTCLSCVHRTPEKVLTCGHALCDTCVRTYGNQSLSTKYDYKLESCRLCGGLNERPSVSLLPPTAGIRVLALDGGGVRGIVPLVFLHRIQLRLQHLGISLPQVFDFVCGTSAGGLVIIGLFLMQWDTNESIRKFEHLAEKTFAAKNSNFTFGRLQQLAMSYLRDHRYSSGEIEKSFQSTFGENIKMFNPLTSDTKVAVTAARGTQPCIFSNYNGGVRPTDIGYELVRPCDASHDVEIGEAACSTSAAPWFFKPKSLKVGTFQDGGLFHNNPVELAMWETAILWPDRADPDFALSIGTGSSRRTIRALSHSPVKSRFPRRLFDAFMWSLDGEKIWQRFYNNIQDSQRHRYHRMNLSLSGPEPAIDDVNGMFALKQMTTEAAENPDHLASIMDSIFASMFYFEFEDMPKNEDGKFACTGHILCRLNLTVEGRRRLYEQLAETQSYFLVLGCPVKCVDRIPKNVPLFKRKVKFELANLDDNIWVTLRGITSKPTSISGLPKNAAAIVKMQCLSTPFGRSDHRRNEPDLPSIPAKRKWSR